MATLTRSSRVKELNEMSDAAVAHGEASDAQRKAAEREAKKAEVRRRLEEAGSKGKKAKKGFLTPERKKKLRKLLMVKAAEDLKRQQLEKEKDRQRILSERTIALPEVESIDDKTKLEAIFKDLEARVFQLESEKWDINRTVGQRDSDINALTIDVNDLRGKYVKPALKKVSKYDNKFKRVGSAAQGEKQDFRASLKVVKKDVMDEIMNAKKEEDKPDWSKKNREEKEEAKEAKEEPKPVEAELAQNEEELATENNEEEQGEEEEEEIEEDEE